MSLFDKTSKGSTGAMPNVDRELEKALEDMKAFEARQDQGPAPEAMPARPPAQETLYKMLKEHLEERQETARRLEAAIAMSVQLLANERLTIRSIEVALKELSVGPDDGDKILISLKAKPDPASGAGG